MLVSILMPGRDQHRYIGQAGASVLEQDLAGTGADLELVVADGASTDGTLEWLKDLAACDERLRVHSAPDTGLAQAIDRAIQRVRGTTLGWLNADDLYAPGTIRRALLSVTAHPAWLAVYGEGQHIDAEGQVVGRYPSAPQHPLCSARRWVFHLPAQHVFLAPLCATQWPSRRIVVRGIRL